MYKYLVFAMLLPFQTSFAQIKVGDKAPSIKNIQWVSNKTKDTSLNNKLIVLDFWATWCAPCLASMPHMNTLVKQNKANKNIIFLAATYEPKKTIEPILKRFRIDAAVITDTTIKILSDFSVRNFPTCIIVDNTGIIQWIGSPSELNNEDIQEILSKKSVPIKTQTTSKIERNPRPSIDSLNNVLKSIYKNDTIRDYFSIISLNSDRIGMKSTFGHKDRMTTLQVQELFRNIITSQTGISNIQLILPQDLERKAITYLYKTSIKSPAIDFIRKLSDTLKLAFDVKDSVTSKFIIKVVDTALYHSKILPVDPTSMARSSDSDTPKIVALSNSPFKTIIPILNNHLKSIFGISTTELADSRLDVVLQTGNFNSLKKSLRLYGLDLEEIKAPLPYWTFRHL